MRKFISNLVKGNLSLLVFFLFVYPNTGISESVQVPFLFIEDEKLETIESYDEILHDKSNAILTDEYLNEPLTKLDFILMQMNEKMEKVVKKLKEGYLKRSYYEDFEKLISFKDWEFPPGINGYVQFNEKQGKIVVSLNIGGAGKPLKPLSTICKSFIKILSYEFPQELALPYYNFLGELYRGDKFEKYEPSLNKIAINVIWEVKITSVTHTEDKKDSYFHNLTCIKDTLSTPDDISHSKSILDLKYIKQSYKQPNPL